MSSPSRLLPSTTIMPSLVTRNNLSARQEKTTSLLRPTRWFSRKQAWYENYVREIFKGLLIISKWVDMEGKHKSWKCRNGQADSELRHSTDFRTVFGIKDQVFCEIKQTCFTDSKGSSTYCIECACFVFWGPAIPNLMLGRRVVLMARHGKRIRKIFIKFIRLSIYHIIQLIIF